MDASLADSRRRFRQRGLQALIGAPAAWPAWGSGQAAVAISAIHDDESAQSWFTSTNPDLGWRSPLVFVRAAQGDEDLGHLVMVAVQDAS
jgi:hypothetical protein